jgi:excisionase family DNA binding protein
MEKKYLSSKEICKIYNITSRTLLNWCYAGKINFIRTKGNHRRYINPAYAGHIYKYCYCRSLDKQQLDKQIEHFRKLYPGYEVISDIGFGSEVNREGFTQLLDFAIEGRVSELVLPTKDTLCTNGFEIIEKIIKKYSNGSIIISNTKLPTVEYCE